MSSRAYYLANRERVIAQVMTYYREHAAEIAEKRKVRYQENRERHLAEKRAYYLSKPDEINARRRARYAANRERVLEQVRTYQAANREQISARRKAKPHQGQANCAIRRARKRGAPVVEAVDRGDIIARDKQRCHICGKRVPKKQIHLDHLIPLAEGGSHSAANLAVAHAACNLRKGTRAANDQLRLVG